MDRSLSFQSIIHVNYLRSESRLSISTGVYDMNELPYISQSRSLLVIVCTVMFFTASCVYMPLGNIQADYDGKCFLDAELHFELTKKLPNSTLKGQLQKFRLNPVTTDWGAAFKCDMTTFTPVMVAILSMLTGWSTFTVWPTMMEIGKGGILMLVYAFLFTLCLGSNIASTIILFAGYRKTCKSLYRANISCNQLNTETVRLKPDGERVIVEDLHRAIVVAEVASAALIGLSCLQVFVSLGTFGIIWYHFNFLAVHLYAENPSTEDTLESPWG